MGCVEGWQKIVFSHRLLRLFWSLKGEGKRSSLVPKRSGRGAGNMQVEKKWISACVKVKKGVLRSTRSIFSGHYKKEEKGNESTLITEE